MLVGASAVPGWVQLLSMWLAGIFGRLRSLIMITWTDGAVVRVAHAQSVSNLYSTSLTSCLARRCARASVEIPLAVGISAQVSASSNFAAQLSHWAVPKCGS